MNTVIIGPATAGAWSSAVTSSTAGAVVRVRRWCSSAEVTCAAAGLRLGRAMSCRKEALAQRLEELALELLAAVVLIAIFMIVTKPETREEPS